MKCNWCNGTGAECGCGEGYCTHCDASGQLADPPFGALRYVLSDDDVNALVEYWNNDKRGETLGEFIQRVAQRGGDIERFKQQNAEDLK